MTHLDALELRLSHERSRLASVKSEHERQLRQAWVAQIEKEISQERDFVGHSEIEMSDDDLLDALRDIP